MPAELSQLEKLHTLNISDNNFSCSDNYPTELIVLCNIESLDISNNIHLPDFEAFCSEGAFAASCPSLQDSVFCIDTFHTLIQTMECGDFLPNSSQLGNISVGIVEVNNINYAYITRTFITTNGTEVDSTLFVGCASLVLESCTVTTDTTICQRELFNETTYEILDFQESWNCTQPEIICINTSVSDRKTKSDFHIFPNPVGDQLYISSNIPVQIHQVTVYDLSGRILKKKRILTTHPMIEMVDFPSGIYILKIQTKAGVETSFRLVKV